MDVGKNSWQLDSLWPSEHCEFIWGLWQDGSGNRAQSSLCDRVPGSGKGCMESGEERAASSGHVSKPSLVTCQTSQPQFSHREQKILGHVNVWAFLGPQFYVFSLQ